MRKLALAFLLLAAPLQAATLYISPSGTNAAPPTGCTTGSPCKTFAYVLPLLAAGDTLILKDGTYASGTTGLLFVTKTGTAALPITIKAENERQALIDGAGSTPFRIHLSSYLVIQGIYCKSADLHLSSPPNGGQVFYITSSDHITVQRMLVTNNNRCYNGSIFSLETVDSSLFEENEVYSYHRNGMGGSQITNNVFRRNYINGRSYADLNAAACSGFGGYPSGPTTTGDSGYIVYPGANNIFENNIAENVGAGFDNEASGEITSTGNKYYGNIVNGTGNGFYLTARGTTLQTMPQNAYVENFVSLGSTSVGVYLRAAKNTIFKQGTVINGAGVRGFTTDSPAGATGDGAPSTFATNILSTGNVGEGFYIANQTTWTLDYPNSYSNTTAFFPTVPNANITHSSTTNPALGSCKVWIPAGTAMKGAGLSGADIGANILYEYVNGVLTSTPLWNTSTNDFVGCGAIVSGVNDTAGNSCSNVDIRLNIGTANSCAFPTGYGGGSTAGGNWLATDNFDTTQTNGSGYVVSADLSGLGGGSGWTDNWAQTTAAVTIAAAPAGTQAQGGNAAFVNADPDFSYKRVFADLSAGLVSWLFRLNTVTPGDAIMFYLMESTTPRFLVKLDTDGVVKLFDGTSFALLGAYTADTWNKITLEFDQAAQPNLVRAKLNSSPFSSWVNSSNYTVINGFKVATLNGSGFASQLYFDAIQEGSASSVQSTIAVVDSGLASQGFYVGTIKALAWSSTDVTGNIDLLISRNGGLTFESIANGIPNSGTYNWTVTGPACSQCRVKVRASSNANINDVSLPFRVFGRHLR